MMLARRTRASAAEGETMRAALYHGRQDLRLTTVPEPQAGPGEVKLRVRYNGICGSDLHEYYDGPITTRSTPHPLTGRAQPRDHGSRAVRRGRRPRRRVSRTSSSGIWSRSNPSRPAVTACTAAIGQYNHCPSLAIQGYNRAGGLAEYTVVKRRIAHRLPPGVTALQGALIEPLAIAWHTANRCAVSAGQTVAIHGAGPIGVGAFLTLRRRGVEAIVVDPSAVRRAALAPSGPAARTRSGRVRRGGGDPRPHRRLRRGCLDRRGRRAEVLRRDAARHARRRDRGGGRDPPPAGRDPTLRPADAGSAPDRRGAVGERLPVGHRARWRAAAIRSTAGSRRFPSSGLIDQGIERLRRQQGMKIVVDVAGRAADAAGARA